MYNKKSKISPIVSENNMYLHKKFWDVFENCLAISRFLKLLKFFYTKYCTLSVVAKFLILRNSLDRTFCYRRLKFEKTR